MQKSEQNLQIAFTIVTLNETCFPLLLSAISLVTAILPVQAANYRSTNGTTIINLSEIGNSNLTSLPRNIGYYHTIINGQRVQGNIEILTRNAAPNNAKYTGTFDEHTGCKGTIALDRTILVGGGVALRAEWTIGQSSKECQSQIGTKFVVNLVENLPVAKDGNHPAQPLNNPFSAESSAWNHPVWKVIDSPSLNCRATPKGKIVKSYPLGTQLVSLNRGVNTFGTDAAGQRWLYLQSQDALCAILQPIFALCLCRTNSLFTTASFLPHFKPF